MHLFIRRLLRLFTVHTVTYQGGGVSNNKFYAGTNWRVRAGIKAKYSKLFGWLLKRSPKWSQVAIVLMFNSRHDCDNTVATIKILLDEMKGVYIPDDNKNYVLMTAQVYDPTLPHNTFEFNIVKIK